MLKVSKSYEETFFRPCLPHEKPCHNAFGCQGFILASILPDCPYPGFILPAFHVDIYSFDFCPICLRADATKKWLLEDKPNYIIQPWQVSLDDYDADACIVPLTFDINDDAPFCGFIHPFPRYSSLSFYYADNVTIKQRGVSKRIYKYWSVEQIIALPRKYLISGMFNVYDVSFCVLLCGLFNNYDKTPGVVSIMHKALSSKSSLFINDPWIDNILYASNNHVYPHAVPIPCTSSMPTILAVREYIMFVVENDFILRQVARLFHPDWDLFAKDTLISCNSFRTNGTFTSHKFKLLTPMKGFYKHIRNLSADDNVTFPSDVYELESQINDKKVNHTVYNLIQQEINDYDYRQIQLPYPNESLSYYICKHCNQYKGPKLILNKHKKLKRSHKSGNTHVQFDIYTGKNKCFKKRSGGRSKEIEILQTAKINNIPDVALIDNMCSKDCDTLITGSHLAHMKHVCIGACEYCKVCFSFTGNSILYGHICPLCLQQTPANTRIFCDICGKQSKKSVTKWLRIPCVADGAKSKMKIVNICKKDTSIKFLSQTPFWTHNYLLNKINEYKINQHTTKRARHTLRS